MAKGGDQPMRNLAGQATKLSRTMHDIRYDAVNDEILVTNPFAQAIITFKGDADGNATPIRIIQGPKTKMGGADRLDVDVVHNEILIPDGDRVLVYPRAANGDVAPLRIIEGKDTHLRSATTLSVDPIHNLLAVGLNKTGRAITMNPDGTMKAQSSDDDGALMVFGRLDQGNVAPRTLVRGPKSGIVRITDRKSTRLNSSHT